jgi:hypothetical protein
MIMLVLPLIGPLFHQFLELLSPMITLVASFLRIVVANDHVNTTSRSVAPSISRVVLADDHVHVDCRVGAANQPVVPSGAPIVVDHVNNVDRRVGAVNLPVVPLLAPVVVANGANVVDCGVGDNNNVINGDAAPIGDVVLNGAVVETVTTVEV